GEVRCPQVRSKEPRGREVQSALFDKFQEQWVTACGSGDLDSVVGSALRQVQHARAVDEQGGAAFAKVEAARIELGEVRQQGDRGTPFTTRETLDDSQKLGVEES